jgi:hypothetical protein
MYRLGTVNPNMQHHATNINKLVEKGRGRQSRLSMVLSSASLSHSTGIACPSRQNLEWRLANIPCYFSLTRLERLKHDPLRAVGSRSRCDLSVVPRASLCIGKWPWIGWEWWLPDIFQQRWTGWAFKKWFHSANEKKSLQYLFIHLVQAANLMAMAWMVTTPLKLFVEPCLDNAD